MNLNLLLALHVIFGAVWFGLAVSFRVQAMPHRRFLAVQTLAAISAIGLGAIIAAVERPDMASASGRLLMAGAGLAVLAALLLGALVVWPTVAASLHAAPMSSGAKRRMIVAERVVAVLLLVVLTLMALAHRI
jgi:hypothetical protein